MADTTVNPPAPDPEDDPLAAHTQPNLDEGDGAEDALPELTPEEEKALPFASTQDIRLLRRAIHDGWDIPEQLFKIAPVKLTRAVAGFQLDDGHKPTFSQQMKAIRIALLMRRQNMEIAGPVQDVEGTTLTPDMDAIEMDATIPKAPPPDEEEVGDAENHSNGRPQ